MKLVVGLGNPGKEYENTRHNAGFALIDKFGKSQDFPEFELNKKFNARISKGSVDGQDFLLAKPQTFMNLSGETVRAMLDFYKLTPDDILVVHDDIDLPLGKYRIATDSSSAGHNGVQNIIDKLGTQKFKRIRIGIGETKEGILVCRIDAHDFVLQKFSKEESEIIEKISEEILEEIKKTLR